MPPVQVGVEPARWVTVSGWAPSRACSQSPSPCPARHSTATSNCSARDAVQKNSLERQVHPVQQYRHLGMVLVHRGAPRKRYPVRQQPCSAAVIEMSSFSAGGRHVSQASASCRSAVLRSTRAASCLLDFYTRMTNPSAALGPKGSAVGRAG